MMKRQNMIAILCDFFRQIDRFHQSHRHGSRQYQTPARQQGRWKINRRSHRKTTNKADRFIFTDYRLAASPKPQIYCMTDQSWAVSA